MSLAPRTMLAVALGGALGSVLRWVVELALPAPAGTLPWATLVVNVVGSAALGAVVVNQKGPTTRHAFLATGLIGGFTTFSTYAVQVSLLGSEAPAVAVVYALLTPLLCVGSAWLGAAGARRAGRS